MRLLSSIFLAATLGLFGFAQMSRAAEHIHDNLQLFSQSALAAANEQINDVWQKQRRMIAIETRNAPTLPARIDAQNKTAVNDFYKRWSHDEFERNKIHGAYVVILKNPSKFYVWVNEDLLRQKIVTAADVSNWEAALVKHLRADEFDAALTDTVASIAAKFTAAPAKDANPRAAAPIALPANNKPVPPPPQPMPAANNEGPSVLTWVLIAVGVFLVFRIIRSLLGAMSNRNSYGPGGMPNQYGQGPAMGSPGYDPGGYGNRGGGFMSGMLGGLFGGMAGNWMYDQMSGGNRAHGAEPHSSSGGHLYDSSSQDSDSGNSNGTGGDGFGGGDWGSDASSGSDFGGGGDFGGDAGGGGDW